MKEGVSHRESENVRELKTKEQLSEFLREVLRRAKSEEEAERLIEEELNKQSFKYEYMGPMIIWPEETAGSDQVLLTLLQTVPEKEKAALQEKMIGLLSKPKDEREKETKKILIETPQKQMSGVPIFDFTKTTRRALVLIGRLGNETNVEVEGVYEVPNDN